MSRAETNGAGRARAGLMPRRSQSLCLAIDIKEFRVWMGRAQTDDRITYAQGPALDNQRDIVVLVKEHEAAGLVRRFTVRRSDGDWDYIAVRREPEASAPHYPREGGAPGATRPRKPIVPLAESEAGKVLSLLRQLANFDQPCPTYQEIALRCGLFDKQRARYLMKQLADGGHIRIESRGPRITQIVTIVETKRSTSRAETPVGKGYEAGTGDGGMFASAGLAGGSGGQ